MCVQRYVRCWSAVMSACDRHPPLQCAGSMIHQWQASSCSLSLRRVRHPRWLLPSRAVPLAPPTVAYSCTDTQGIACCFPVSYLQTRNTVHKPKLIYWRPNVVRVPKRSGRAAVTTVVILSLVHMGTPGPWSGQRHTSASRWCTCLHLIGSLVGPLGRPVVAGGPA